MSKAYQLIIFSVVIINKKDTMRLILVIKLKSQTQLSFSFQYFENSLFFQFSNSWRFDKLRQFMNRAYL